jgi:hypothetical protein
MAVRVVLFSERHPDGDAGHIVLVDKLKNVVGQLEQEEAVQRNALMDRHTGSLDKQRIDRELRLGPIATVVRAAELARRDEPSLATQIQFQPSGNSFDGHLVAARALLEEARANQEVLGRYGVSEAVLGLYQGLLGQLEAAIKVVNESRAVHMGATPHLTDLGNEARGIVRTLDARNRIRFKNDPKLLGEWISARTILGQPGPGSGEAPESGGDVRPAA